MYPLIKKFNPTSRRRELRTLLSLCLLLLAACGGYNSGTSNGAPSPSITFDVQPTAIALGESAQLNWTATAAATCTASGDWSGAEPLSGTLSVVPAALGTATYTLTCQAPAGGTYTGGNASKTVTVGVTAASVFSNTELAADTATALVLDPRLVNPWGVAMSSTSTAWVANDHSDTATLYDGNGRAQPAANPRTVVLPASLDGTPFEPTGIVANASADFVIGNGNASGPAKFLFVGRQGSIAGWSPAADANNAIVVYDDPTAVYTGLAIAGDGIDNFLYAANFHSGRVDVFDTDFVKQETSGTQFVFADTDLPDGFAPFGIQALATGTDSATQIYVAFAQQSAPENLNVVTGPGLGQVDVFDLNGQLLKQLVVVSGMLNAPWGIAIAPDDFGSLSHRLLVSNFGDGRINAFGTLTGQFGATLKDSHAEPVVISGLRGIVFGNDVNNQPHNTLFYAAGPNDGINGTFGRIDVGATPPLLNQPPVVVVSAPAPGEVRATVAVTANVQSSIAVAKIEFFVDATSIGVVTAAPYTLQWDTTAFADGSVVLTAMATDVDDNVGTSAEVAVSIANAAPAVTLAQIQAEVFTPVCSGCHNGSNPPTGALPGSQNLTAGNAFANLVNVSSLEIPALLRVKPNDPANSYLVRKLEGAAGIQGARMPLGGAPLDPATLDRIRAWIASGAANN